MKRSLSSSITKLLSALLIASLPAVLTVCLLSSCGAASTNQAGTTAADGGKEETRDAGKTEKETDTGSEGEKEMEDKIDVLFVGNSFTYYNEMPGIFEDIAKSAGISAKVRSVTEGSARLEWFVDPEQSVSAEFTEALDKAGYEYVFLQEQSTRPYKNYDKYVSGIDSVRQRILEKSPEAKIFLYETWGLAEDHESMAENGLTTLSMEQLLFDAAVSAGEETDLPVCFAGVSMYRMYKDTEFSPYHTDLKHPSYKGSVEVALTLFYSVFPDAEKDAVTFDRGLDGDCMDQLKAIAYTTAHSEDPASLLTD